MDRGQQLGGERGGEDWGGEVGDNSYLWWIGKRPPVRKLP